MSTETTLSDRQIIDFERPIIDLERKISELRGLSTSTLPAAFGATVSEPIV